MKYIEGLDSLRAVAVILVIISHWMPGSSLVQLVPVGGFGVDCFFVLSGFLISKILFENRMEAELNQIPAKTILKNFYLRRALRIFPIYYLTIFTALAVHRYTQTEIYSAFAYYATYTQNIYYFKINDWDGMLSHLWTLAVEEQFYMLWPAMILFIHTKHLAKVIMGVVSVGVAGHYLLDGIPMVGIMTFTCFDAFGLGALLAWQITFRPEAFRRFYALARIGGLVSCLFFVLVVIQGGSHYLPARTIHSLISFWIIAYIVLHQGKAGVTNNWLLTNRALIFLGKISYGIYLYHLIIPRANMLVSKHVLQGLLPGWMVSKPGTPLFLIENALILVLLSWCSFHLIEKRFLRLKKHFGGEAEKKEAKPRALARHLAVN
jgi:peptidoglycan/LPS O-acetylase OafA/YrhL